MQEQILNDHARNFNILRRLGAIGFWFFFLKGCLWAGALGITFALSQL